MRSALRATAAALIAAAPVLCPAATTYTITDLGVLPAAKTGTYAYALNGQGHVAGVSGQPFLWQPGQMASLNASLPVTPFAPARTEDVNDSGVVVGWYTSSSSTATIHPFRWVNGAFSDLSPSSTSPERAVAVNNTGDVLVESLAASYILRPNGTKSPLTGFTAGTPFYPADLNDAGQVAGSALATADKTTVAALWQNGSATALGALAGDVNSAATAINQQGDVVGYSWGPIANGTNVRPFLLSLGVMTALPPRAPLESCIAVAVNGKGQAVGFVGTNTRGGEAAALLWEEGLVKDLQTLLPPGSGWWLRAARDINDAGQITGYGVLNGAYRAFLLTPVPPIPLPGDANNDGAITMDDAAMVTEMAVGIRPLSNLTLADVAPSPSDDPRGYGDGQLDARDAVLIIRLANGLE